MTKEVKEVFEESHEIYGSPKITKVLNQKGIKACQKYVYSIMKEQGIKPQYINGCRQGAHSRTSLQGGFSVRHWIESEFIGFIRHIV
ncbi:IS3 family transposase [Erysipelotrichaceae bacterium 66-17]